MIEIKKRNGIWEAYVGGGLFTYSEDLENVLDCLNTNSEEIAKELDEE